jgi:hypothetical protein
MDTRFRYLVFSIAILALVQQAAASHMLMYGNARIDGKPVPSGATIVARMADGRVGNCTVTDEGVYGILITSNESGYAPMNFYTGNLEAVQMVSFISEGVMEIDLDFKKVEETTTTIGRAELPTTAIQIPGIMGRAVSFTAGNGLVILFILVLAFIFYSIRDLL